MAPVAWRKPPGSRPAAMICRTARASTVWPGDLDRFLTGLQVRLRGAEALPGVPQIVAAADDRAAARAESRRHRRYYRGTRRLPSVAVRENADGAHRPFQGTNLVRHASVATATQRSTATQGDTPRDKEETARRAAFSQLAGRFRRWWQVLGSNQRRLSRRFYSPSLLPEAHATDQHKRRSRLRPGVPPSAMCPCVLGLAHGRGRKNPRTGPVGTVTPTVRPASCL